MFVQKEIRIKRRYVEFDLAEGLAVQTYIHPTSHPTSKKFVVGNSMLQMIHK